MMRRRPRPPSDRHEFDPAFPSAKVRRRYKRAYSRGVLRKLPRLIATVRLMERSIRIDWERHARTFGLGWRTPRMVVDDGSTAHA